MMLQKEKNNYRFLEPKKGKIFYDEIYAFDFETTTVVKGKNEPYGDYRERIKKFNTQVYSWGLIRKTEHNINKDKFNGENYEYVDGVGFDKFIERILCLKHGSKLYAHNGAKFDAHFLINQLYESGFKQVIFNIGDKLEVDEELYENNEIIIENDFRDLELGEFTLLTDETGKVYKIEMAVYDEIRKRTKYYNKKTKKREIDDRKINGRITILDSNLLFMGSVKIFGEILNKNYEVDYFAKATLKNGYTRTELYKSYEEFQNDSNEQFYLLMDCAILIEYLYMMNLSLPFWNWKTTAAGTAYNIWKYPMFGKKLLKKYCEDKLVSKFNVSKNKTNPFYKYKIKNIKYYVDEKKAINYCLNDFLDVSWLDEDSLHPILGNYKYLVDAYSGGISQSAYHNAGVQIKNVAYIDINSDFPYQMVSKLMPIGKPLEIGGRDYKGEYLKLYSVKIEEAKNDKGLPFLIDFLKERINKEGEVIKAGSVYPKELFNKTYLLTDIEVENIKKYYNGKITYKKTLTFNAVKGDFIFGEYIDYFYELKSRKISVSFTIFAKIMLNSLYGKFGEDIEKTSKIIDISGKSQNKITKVNSASHYLPIAIWITAYARMYLVEAIGDKFKDVVQLDTDSIVLKIPYEVNIKNLKDEKWNKEVINYLEKNFNVEIDSKELGKWKIEHFGRYFIGRRAKQYFMKIYDLEKEKPQFILKFAGLRLEDKKVRDMNPDLFVYGTDEENLFKQKRPFSLPTGLVLEEYEKKINPIWNYNLNPSYWFQNEESFKKNIKTKTKECGIIRNELQ